jgi:hypothetical protein
MMAMNVAGRRPKKWVRITGEDRTALESRMIELYRGGASVREISRQTGRSYGAVHKMLIDAGVVMRRRGKPQPREVPPSV